jgi:hypothetical protein
LQASLNLPTAEIMVSFENLKTLGLTYASVEQYNPHVTDKGSLFLAAVAP